MSWRPPSLRRQKLLLPKPAIHRAAIDLRTRLCHILEELLFLARPHLFRRLRQYRLLFLALLSRTLPPRVITLSLDRLVVYPSRTFFTRRRSASRRPRLLERSRFFASLVLRSCHLPRSTSSFRPTNCRHLSSNPCSSPQLDRSPSSRL